MASEMTIRISLEAYQELVLRKIDTGIPIARQVDDLVIPKKGAKRERSKPIQYSK